MLEKFINPEDTVVQVNNKKAYIQAFLRPKKDRTNNDLDKLYRFLIDYKFFANMQNQHGKQSVMETMKHIQLQRIDQHGIVFDQGERGDKFYIILKGCCAVDIAFDTPVDNFKPKASIQVKIRSYLQMLYDHYD